MSGASVRGVLHRVGDVCVWGVCSIAAVTINLLWSERPTN